MVLPLKRLVQHRPEGFPGHQKAHPLKKIRVFSSFFCCSEKSNNPAASSEPYEIARLL